MGRIILWMSISVDGFMEGPDHDLSWSSVDDVLHQHFNDELRTMGAFVEGRLTFETMSAFWPTAGNDPDSSAVMVDFAGIWREMPKIVFSRTLQESEWASSIEREVTVERVREIQAEYEGDLVVGGARLGDEFLRLGLVDELRLYVHPVVLGSGTPLFKHPLPRSDWELHQTHVFGNGVVMLRYGARS